MRKFSWLIFLPFLLAFSQCSGSTSSHQASNTNRGPDSSADYRNWLVGTWEGRTYDNGRDDQLVMYVIFKDNNLTVDYSPRGGATFTEPYRFIDGRTIEAGRYPEKLIVERRSDDEIRFRPEGERLRVDIEMIYACRFIRVVK
jgi:hypothetical protein